MARSQPVLRLTGNSLKRFVTDATLLALIDPVRGEPTTYSLDRHPHDTRLNRERLQKKALDSFALICSTSRKGAETASAATLEEGYLSGGSTIIRVARNHGVPPDVLSKLQSIVQDLVSFSQQGTAEASIDGLLLKIIDLDKDKIQYLLELVRTEKVRNIIDDQMRHLDHVDEALARELGETFRAWISNLPVIARLPAAAEAEALVPHIRWAAHAKWTYSQHLEAIFCPGEEEVPKWMHKIYKLGRYAVAAKVLLQFARNRPELFTSISIQALEAPQINRFALDWEKSPLKTVIERLTGGGHEEYINQLGKFWLSEAPETKFRKACKLDLTVHAEMQLIAFYDHHPELSLGLPFMGTSKKACFFCNWFLGRHPLGMRISACHQKLYPSWTMAPCTDSRVYNSYTKLIGLLSKYLEETIARDLGTRLGLKRPRVLDSTSGHPSLPGPGSLDLSVRDALPNQEPSGSTLATAAFTNEASDSDQSETFSG